MLASFRTSARSPLLQVLKTSVAAIVAWLLCVTLLNQPTPIFAAIAALLVVQPSVNQSLSKGIERSVGVILGVILAYVVGRFLGSDTWIVLSIIVLSLLIAWVLRLTPASSNQIPISAMLVLIIGSQTAGYAIDRVIETIIGAVVGLVVNALIVPPVLVSPARDAVADLASGVADALREVAAALVEQRSPAELDDLLTRARELRPLQETASDALLNASDSLALNPLGARHRGEIDDVRLLLARLGTLVTRSIGMTRAVHDNYDPALIGDPVVTSIAVQLERAAHDTDLLARGHAPTAAQPTGPTAFDDAPLLTAPLVVPRPDPVNWVLIGSLLEDLRRIREEIVGADA